MNNFFKAKTIVGINFGLNDLSLMSFKLQKDKPLVLGYAAEKLDLEKNKHSLENDDGYLEEKIKELMNKIVGKSNAEYCCVSIPSIKSFSRSLQLPAKIKKDIKEAIDLEIEQYIPIPKDLLISSYQIVDQIDDNINVLLSATPINMINRIITICESANLTPILIEPSMNSIARLLKIYEKANLNTLIIDIGLKHTDIAILDKAVKVTSSITVGGDNFTRDIAKNLNITPEKAHQLKILKGFTKSEEQKLLTKSLDASLSPIINEIKKIIRYNENRLNGKKIEQVLITGISSNVAGLSDWLTDQLVMPVRLANPWKNFSFNKIDPPKETIIARYLNVASFSTINPLEIIND